MARLCSTAHRTPHPQHPHLCATVQYYLGRCSCDPPVLFPREEKGKGYVCCPQSKELAKSKIQVFNVTSNGPSRFQALSHSIQELKGKITLSRHFYCDWSRIIDYPFPFEEFRLTAVCLQDMYKRRQGAKVVRMYQYVSRGLRLLRVT